MNLDGKVTLLKYGCNHHWEFAFPKENKEQGIEQKEESSLNQKEKCSQKKRYQTVKLCFENCIRLCKAISIVDWLNRRKMSREEIYVPSNDR